MVEKRTDLAIEARESFPEDNVEIKGVVLDEKIIQDGCIRISTVNIINEITFFIIYHLKLKINKLISIICCAINTKSQYSKNCYPI